MMRQMSNGEVEQDWRAGATARVQFIWDVLPTGLVPILAIAGIITLLVGGSILEIFQLDPWFGVLIVVVAISFAAFEGTFRRWRDAVEVADTGGTLPASLSGTLRTLIAQGETLCQKLEGDENWGVIHHESGFQGWNADATNVLNAEVPELAIWLHQMNSPSRRLQALPDAAKGRALAQFRWSIDRLADIEDVVLARQEGGHPGGHKKTEHLLLFDRCLKLLQESDLLKRNLSPGLSMFPGHLDGAEVDRLIIDCSGRMKAALAEAFGATRAEELVAAAVLEPQRTIRGDVDRTEAEAFLRRHQALRDALRLDELTIRP